MPSAITGVVRTETGTPPFRGVLLLTNIKGLQVARAPVAADGRYAIDEVEPGSYTLVATASGYAPRVATVRIGGATGEASGYETQTVENFLLAGTTELAGTVQSSAGPVVGAAVVAMDDDGSVLSSATTDSAGRFDIPRLPGGTITVAASAPGHAPEAMLLPEQLNHRRHIAISLHSVTLLAGTVTYRDGAGVGHVTVAAVDAGGTVAGTAITDGKGRYELPGLVPGDYTLIGAKGPVGVRTVTVNAGEKTNVDLQFDASTG
ncbi:MAG TPA: carboxypeptidase-like regulatory domain-containing protein [Mycobacteriales bacterium]|nr:carboxypeptidase-like regulatory domain-containing protein [Mycobacteriales bacterium]